MKVTNKAITISSDPSLNQYGGAPMTIYCTFTSSVGHDKYYSQ